MPVDLMRGVYGQRKRLTIGLLVNPPDMRAICRDSFPVFELDNVGTSTVIDLYQQSVIGGIRDRRSRGNSVRVHVDRGRLALAGHGERRTGSVPTRGMNSATSPCGGTVLTCNT